LTVDFTEVILVVLPENLPCCYHAREGSIRVTTTFNVVIISTMTQVQSDVDRVIHSRLT